MNSPGEEYVSDITMQEMVDMTYAQHSVAKAAVSQGNLSKTELLAQFQYEWSLDPILAVTDLFGVEPTSQQKELIALAWKPYARVAVSSCTGAGKTATLAWLTFILLLTQEDCRILVTSPSAQQLTRVYQSEARKWRGKMPPEIAECFEITQSRVTLTVDELVQQADLVTASAENKESLAGGHSKNYVILADEASGIDEATFDYLIGTLSTDSGGRFIMTSNPTRSSGRFYEIFHRDEIKNWDTLYFEAFDVPHISKQWIQDIVQMYGEDSDQYRIRILGQFPRATSTQFLSSELVDRAMEAMFDPQLYMGDPVIIGCDVARFGDDETVFVARQGPKILDITRHKGKDTQEVAALLFEYQNRWRGTVVYIDAIGIGAGVFDRCKALRMPVREVISSKKPTKPLEYVNVRSQLWGEMKNWLMTGADIPYMADLREQLVGMTYGYNAKMQLALTTKKDLKKQGLTSPDIADAIALTFGGDVQFIQAARPRARSVKKSSYFWG